MAEDQNQKEELKEKPMSFMTLVILTGIVAGMFFSGMAYFAYILNFTKIPPRVILEPWALGDWKGSWLGTVISILLYGGISIIAALIYYAFLRKINSMWAGIGYGLALFLLVFFVLHPLFPGIEPFNQLELNTIVTSVCFYALYGLFVGYTISYEEYAEQQEDNGDNEEVPST
nr:YqhR family membrane protein [uncultured Bacillus sp.]